LYLDGYDTAERRVAFFDELVARARAVPGVVAAAATNNLPMTPNGSLSGITVEGRTPRETDPRAVEMHSVTADFFETLAIPLKQGRTLSAADGAGGPVAVVNTAMAVLYWDGDAVGRRFKFGDADSPSSWITVVGVVGNVHQMTLGDEAGPALYQIHQQRPFVFGNLIARTSTNMAGTLPALRQAVWSIDPNLAIEESGRLLDQMQSTVTEPRFYTWLLTGFAAVALLLAAVGIYGTISFSVARRAREIGIRMAFGAAGRHVSRLILKQGAVLAGMGLVIGLAGATVLSRTLNQLVFGIGTTDVPTYAVGAATLFVVGMLASWVPARRATRVVPMRTLRVE